MINRRPAIACRVTGLMLGVVLLSAPGLAYATVPDSRTGGDPCPACVGINSVDPPSTENAGLKTADVTAGTVSDSLLRDVTFGSVDLQVAGPAQPPTSTVRHKHKGRALLEAGAFVTWSATNYWRKYSSFIEDWQFQLNWKDQRRKLFTGEGTRLDSNNMRLNWTHGWAGAMYYTFARSNGVSAGGSYFFSAGGSLLWEYVVEWREVSSINDHVFTAVGGGAIAEPLFQIGSYFRNRTGTVNRVAEVLSNPFIAANDLLNGKRRAERVPADEWHDFQFSVGGRHGALTDDGTSGMQGQMNLDLRLVTLRDYGRTGSGAGYSRGTIDSGFHANLDMFGGSVEEFRVATHATLFGWWRKNVRLDDEQRRHGYDFWFGARTAWDIFQNRPIADYDGHDLGYKKLWFPRPSPTQYTDKISSVHFPGPAFSVTAYAGELRTRLDLGAAINFSMVNSLAFNEYTATHDFYGVKTTLHNWGYYYALGSTLTARVEAEYGVLKAAGGVDFRRFQSIQGLDRYQSQITDDAPLHDARYVSSASLTAQVPRSPIFSTVTIEHIARNGQFHDVDRHQSETRVSYLVGFTF